MAGLKVFLALCCIAATSAVQLERKPFKRLIPADVLRGESIQFILYQTDVRRCRYKPSSLLRPYIADTSALSMLELGLMPVVTTMGEPARRPTLDRS